MPKWWQLLSRWSYLHRVDEHRRDRRRFSYPTNHVPAAPLEPLEPRVLLSASLASSALADRFEARSSIVADGTIKVLAADTTVRETTREDFSKDAFADLSGRVIVDRPGELMRTAAGQSRIDGTAANDFLVAQSTTGLVIGGGGDDTLAVLPTAVELAHHVNVDAGDGDDFIYAMGGQTTVDGGAGYDVLFVGDANASFRNIEEVWVRDSESWTWSQAKLRAQSVVNQSPIFGPDAASGGAEGTSSALSTAMGPTQTDRTATAPPQRGSSSGHSAAPRSFSMEGLLASTSGGSPTEFFQQDFAGPLVLEAEDFMRNIEGEADASGFEDDWVLISDANASGGSAMHVTGADLTDYVTEWAAPGRAAQLSFDVEFLRSGTHYVWVRGKATGGGDDSVHVGLNGAIPNTSDDIMGFGNPYGQYTWSNATTDGPDATLDIASTGIYTVDVWMREDGFKLDKLLITSDPTFVPTGDGPSSSPMAYGGLAAPLVTELVTDVYADSNQVIELTVEDVDVLRTRFGAVTDSNRGSNFFPDGYIDENDVKHLVYAIAKRGYGDTNFNGLVEQGDLDLVLQNWGATSGTWSSGDFNGNQQTEQGDMDIVLQNWGNTADTPRTVTGGAGNDVLYGLNGNDTFDGGGGDDFIWGGEGNDILVGGPGNDEIRGREGADQVYGGDGDDVLYGDEGEDYIEADHGNDYVEGGLDADFVNGGSGDDTISLGEGVDYAHGGPGRDTIDGGADDDLLISGSGVDTLIGGDGFFDAFVYQPGIDTVDDPEFDRTATIDADGDGVSIFAENTYALSDSDEDFDGDGLYDGWEIMFSAAPYLVNNDAHVVSHDPAGFYPDDDGDGLNAFNEFLGNTDPDLVDTDGDSKSDLEEAISGESPITPNEEDKTPIQVRVTIGDSSGSDSEIWKLRVGPEEFRNASWGTVNSYDSTKHHAGESYQISLHHVSTNLGEGIPDYDWQAHVDVLDPAAQGWFITGDPSNLLLQNTGDSGDDIYEDAKRIRPVLHILDFEAEERPSIFGSTLIPVALKISDNFDEIVILDSSLSLAFDQNIIRLYGDVDMQREIHPGTALQEQDTDFSSDGEFQLYVELLQPATTDRSDVEIAASLDVTGALWSGLLEVSVDLALDAFSATLRDAFCYDEEVVADVTQQPISDVLEVFYDPFDTSDIVFLDLNVDPIEGGARLLPNIRWQNLAQSSGGAVPGHGLPVRVELEEPATGNANHTITVWSDVDGSGTLDAGEAKVDILVQLSEFLWSLPQSARPTGIPSIANAEQAGTTAKTYLSNMVDSVEATYQDFEFWTLLGYDDLVTELRRIFQDDGITFGYYGEGHLVFGGSHLYHPTWDTLSLIRDFGISPGIAFHEMWHAYNDRIIDNPPDITNEVDEAIGYTIASLVDSFARDLSVLELAIEEVEMMENGSERRYALRTLSQQWAQTWANANGDTAKRNVLAVDYQLTSGAPIQRTTPAQFAIFEGTGLIHIDSAEYAHWFNEQFEGVLADTCNTILFYGDQTDAGRPPVREVAGLGKYLVAGSPATSGRLNQVISE